jgi:hypothetical protein
MKGDFDVESRLRSYAQLFRREANPRIDLAEALTAGVRQRSPRPPGPIAMVRAIAMAGGVLLAGLIIAFGVLQLRTFSHKPPTPPITLHTSTPSATPEPTTSLSPTASPTASPSASSSSGCARAESYGLLISSGSINLISPRGCVGATVAFRDAAVPLCADGLPSVVPPPVSASDDKVYYRDGDTQIRFIAPDGTSGAVTTVPGGTARVSFFSVSPDDRRIAVMVEDFAPAATIELSLYVEDLRGGHRTNLYSATIHKAGGDTTMWPVGWHQGNLVVATVPACSSSPVYHPSAWRVLDASTGAEVAHIDTSNCFSRLTPSPAGVVCFDSVNLDSRRYDWTGAMTSHQPQSFQSITQSPQLSPSGQDYFIDRDGDWWAQAWAGGSGMRGTVQGRPACQWINDSAIMTPDSVVAYPSATVTPLPLAGQCAGRLPGGL